MRKVFFALAIALFALVGLATDKASATTRGPYVCWEQTNGTTACADLPGNYRIDGVKRPYCDRKDACNNGAVDFKLTDEIIHQLGAYITVTTMRPYHLATLYDDRWLHHHHHHHRHHHDHEDGCRD